MRELKRLMAKHGTQSFKLWSVRSLLIRERTDAANRICTEARTHTCAYAGMYNMYTPITARGRGLGPVLPMTLFQDRLMRLWISPADQVTAFWPLLPGLKETCKCSAQPAWHQCGRRYFWTFPQWKRLEVAELFEFRDPRVATCWKIAVEGITS